MYVMMYRPSSMCACLNVPYIMYIKNMLFFFSKNDNISVPYSFQSFMEDAKLATLTGSLKQLDSDDFVQR